MDATEELGDPAVAARAIKPLELLRRLRDSSPPVGGLLCDLAGVLYDDTDWQRWLFRLIGRMGVHTHYAAFFRLWRCEYLNRVQRGQLGYWDALRLMLRSVGLSRGQIDEVQAAGYARWRQSQDNPRLLPGVAETLATLSSYGIPMVLFCTGGQDRVTIERCLARLKLQDCFCSVLSVLELAKTPSNSAPLQQAIDQLRLPAHQIAFVGHDTVALQEAALAGLRTVAFNYEDDAVAERYLEQFPELLHALPWYTARARVG